MHTTIELLHSHNGIKTVTKPKNTKTTVSHDPEEIKQKTKQI
jgi:hypothetical protein